MNGNITEQSRALVLAKSAPEQKSPPIPPIPMQMGSGRVPDGGQGANNNLKMKSIFDGGTSNPQITAKLMGQRAVPPQEPPRAASARPMVYAKMGQQSDVPQAPSAPTAPAAPSGVDLPPTNVQDVLIRESGPRGLTRKEASDIASVLLDSLKSAAAAVAAGQTCVGVDGSTLDTAKNIQSQMAKFGSTGNSDDRLDLESSEVDIIERIIECASVYEKVEAAAKGRTIAFVAGGLIIGAVVLLATS